MLVGIRDLTAADHWPTEVGPDEGGNRELAAEERGAVCVDLARLDYPGHPRESEHRQQLSLLADRLWRPDGAGPDGLRPTLFLHPLVREAMAPRLRYLPTKPRLVTGGSQLPAVLSRAALLVTDYSSLAWDASVPGSTRHLPSLRQDPVPLPPWVLPRSRLTPVRPDSRIGGRTTHPHGRLPGKRPPAGGVSRTIRRPGCREPSPLPTMATVVASSRPLNERSGPIADPATNGSRSLESPPVPAKPAQVSRRLRTHTGDRRSRSSMRGCRARTPSVAPPRVQPIQPIQPGWVRRQAPATRQ